MRGGWRYRLTLQKQPGTDARKVTVTLQLPAEAELLASSPPFEERHRGALTYSVDLRTDVQLDLTWRRVERE